MAVKESVMSGARKAFIIVAAVGYAGSLVLLAQILVRVEPRSEAYGYGFAIAWFFYSIIGAVCSLALFGLLAMKISLFRLTRYSLITALLTFLILMAVFTANSAINGSAWKASGVIESNLSKAGLTFLFYGVPILSVLITKWFVERFK